MGLKKKTEKKVTFSYLPFHQRLKLFFINNWIYMLIFINMIIFIWLMMPSSHPIYYNPGIVSIETADDLRLSKECFLPYWRDTSLMLDRHCIQTEFSDDIINIENEIVRLRSCQTRKSDDLWQSPNDFFHFLPINIIPISHKKVISFSLYGTANRYLRNTIKIIRKYKELLPDWIPRFWLASDVPFLMINRLLHEDVEIILVYQRQPEMANVTRPPGFHGMFWRFFVSDDQHVERYIVRDIDSMPIQREVDAIKSWIKEKSMFHVMRDHPQHAIEILGGMWGGLVDKMVFSASKEYETALTIGYDSLDAKGLDQAFLKRYVWPIVKHQMTCHSSYQWLFVDSKGCKRFPTPRDGKTFVGDVIGN